jgi:xanthine/uracil permease
MKYSTFASGIASLQWFVFLLANSLTLPIVIGQIYHLPVEEIAGLMQRTFFVVGVSSFLSGWIGHRLPIPDGPAGIWLGIFVLMGEMAASHGTDASISLRLLEGGMLITGATMIVFGLTGWMNRMLKVFTPLVTGVYLMLLAFQLSGVFLKGMIGVSEPTNRIVAGNVAISFLVFALVLAFSIWGKGWLRNYAVLIGIMIGWLLFVLANGAGDAPQIASAVLLPDIFVWGAPNWDIGMIVSAVMVAFVLMSNIIASVSAMEQVLEESTPDAKEAVEPGENRGNLNRAGFMGGLSNALSSVFSTVGVVPLSIAAGFVRMTGQSKKTPYLIACVALVIVSLVPYIYSILSLLPGPIAYAAMLASFAQMIGIGLTSVLKLPLDQRRLTILGVALSLGTGVMFLPKSVFVDLPTVVQYILGNGLMIGMLAALFLEQIWRPAAAGAAVKKTQAETAAAAANRQDGNRLLQ